MKSFHLTGLIAAPFTPMTASGALNLKRIPALAKRLIADGVSGAFICGTTGEGQSLSREERCAVAEAWRRAAPPSRLKLIVQVGTLSGSASRLLAAHAQKIGADAVASIAPSFFKPSSISGLVEWCADVAAAAPKLPFYYYHFPAITGVNFNMAEFVPLALAKIPNFGGVKFTHENLMDYALALDAASDKCDVLFGRDEILPQALTLGAAGAVGSTYNYSAPIYRKMLDAWKARDWARVRALQMKNLRFIEILSRFGGIPAGKAIMGLVGVDCGPVREPLVSLDKTKTAALRHALEKSGFFKALDA